ncbi:MAG: SurA N-terminal domain-containing protein [Pseudomonadota bacterium]|nr:SurA N-terminal domain-containing protein [Pseudomonadota bacterium]
MLQSMRKFANSWVASIFMGLLALSFGVWGIADIFTGSSDTTVASVGGVKISQTEFQSAYQNDQRIQSARMGVQLTPEQAQAMGLGQQSLQNLINRTALGNEADRLGLTAADKQVVEQIQSMPQFAGPTGSFDHQTFLRTVGEAGYTEQSFIAAMRADTANSQLLDAAKNGLAMPPGYAKALFDYINELRAVHYVEVPQSAAGTPPTPSDAQLEAYVKAHADSFSTPEYRQITYVLIQPSDVMDQVSVTDAQLKQQYDLNKDQYQIPETRDVEQITFPDLKSAQAASDKIKAGTSFEDIATARGLKPSDINLGTIPETDLGADRGPVAFALALNGISAPVKGTFGYVLLKVTKITPGSSKSFDQVKDALRKDALEKLAGNKISDISNRFEDAMAGGDTLAEAGQKVGLHVVHVAAVDRNGLAPDGSKAAVPAQPQFLTEVFKANVGVAGDPIQLSDGTMFAILVEGDTPPKLKPLDAVRAAATAGWQADAMQKALVAKAETLAKEANAAGSLGNIARQLNVAEQDSPVLQRGKPDGVFGSDLVNAIFAAPPGTAVFGKADKGGAYIVARVTGVRHPQPAEMSDPRYKGFLAQIGAQVGEDIPPSLAMAARARQGVRINQKMVDGVIGGGSGS